MACSHTLGLGCLKPYNLNRYTASHKWLQELLRLSREQAYKMVWHAAYCMLSVGLMIRFEDISDCCLAR